MSFFRIGKICLAVICTAGLVAACGTPDALTYKGGKPLNITGQVWSYYQTYLTKQGGVRKDGVFLVAVENDTGVGARYSYCPQAYDYCVSGGLNVAKKLCDDDHLTCVLFARGSKIVIPYKLID